MLLTIHHPQYCFCVEIAESHLRMLGTCVPLPPQPTLSAMAISALVSHFSPTDSNTETKRGEKRQESLRGEKSLAMIF